MRNEKVGDAICRMSREGKSYEEIFREIVNNNREMGLDYYDTKRKKQGLANSIAQILSINVQATAKIPDEFA